MLKTKHDVIRQMERFPDKIIEYKDSMFNSGIFHCSKCGELKCDNNQCKCGSIFWTKQTVKDL